MGAQPEKFRFLIPDADTPTCVSACRERASPDQGPGEPWAYGAELSYLRSLIEYWRVRFDWRAQEARLKCLSSVQSPASRH